jgi:hypothetical protein
MAEGCPLTLLDFVLARLELAIRGTFILLSRTCNIPPLGFR